MIISRTPLRLSLFGGSTDLSTFYESHGSFLINAALTKYVYILVMRTPPIFNYRTVVQYSKIEHLDDNSLIKHDGCRGVLQYLNIKDGLQILNTIDLPARSGLGSSSSYVVGLLNCCYHLLRQHQPSKRQLSDEAIYIERTLLQESGGIQDQISASYGGFNVIEIDKGGYYKVKPISITQEFAQELQQSMVLFYVGQRNSFQIAQSHNTPKAEQYKQRILEIAKESLPAFENEDIPSIGKLLDETWQQKRQTSSLISNTEIDDLYNHLKYHDCLGVKLLGSGGSGFLLCITNEPQKLINSTQLQSIDFSFDYEGSKIILS